MGINPLRNKAVLIKPNFNTADPVPGSTHNDTLVAADPQSADYCESLGAILADG